MFVERVPVPHFLKVSIGAVLAELPGHLPNRTFCGKALVQLLLVRDPIQPPAHLPARKNLPGYSDLYRWIRLHVFHPVGCGIFRDHVEAVFDGA